MKEKVQDFRGLSALLPGNQAEPPGKHLQRTSAFSLASLIPHCLYGRGKYPMKPPVTLFTKDDDSAKTVPVEYFFDGHVFGLFVPLPAPFLIGFTQEANISLEAGVGLIMFPVLCLPFFTQYQSTLILVPTSIRTK